MRCLCPVLLAAVLVGLSSPLVAGTTPNIFLITIDTTRADRMGFLGSRQQLTPNLDALARDSIVFTHVYSQVPLTTASHATILSGTYPQFHGVNDAGVALPRTIPYAPAILRLHGYATAAFVGSVILDPKAGGAPGFERGFGTYDAGFHNKRAGEDRYHSVERRGVDVIAHAATWVKSHSHEPMFVWIHLYDPHAPYDPPEPFRGKVSSSAYDGEIAYVDSAVGKLLEQLRTDHVYDTSIVAVMSDHGEAFGEHGERGHGIFLYEPTIHVPLLIKGPKQRAAGRRVEEPSGLVDVLPTLLEMAGLTVPKAVQGKSLLPLAYGDQTAGKLTTLLSSRGTYSETDYPRTQFSWSALRSLRKGKYLFIDAPRREIYDKSADPGAEHNLAPQLAAVTNTFVSDIGEFRRRTAATRTSDTQLSPEQVQKLRALGYVSSTDSPKSSPSAVGGIDPKDKIEVANEMTEANLALEDGDASKASTLLQNVIKMDPDFAAAYTSLGQIYESHGDITHAIAMLRKAVELRPESVSAHYGLGMAYFEAGDFHSAAPQFEEAVSRNRQSAEMHYSLASVYVRIGRMQDAQHELEQALARKPMFFDANLMLGQVFVVQRKPSLAIPYLKKAERIRPNSPQVHLELAKAYDQLGDNKAAERERQVAARH